MNNNINTEEILSALEHAQPVKPSEVFLRKMEAISESYIAVNDKISSRSILGIAASFAILVFINVSLLKDSNQANIANDTFSTESAYNLVPTKSIYDE